ncbi:glycosyltransferase [Desulfogranum mediterraneum]|uniref:glycosyltransferase n=1 Tax=Desulfogranum mediterraneum TaxID=160661 RepID=UPI00041F6C4B|nr:glycosyltransferase [Desulfogranum mediterraneum]
MSHHAKIQISVLMAVRNGATYLRDALDGLCQQTHPADEIVVVDDASDDDTSCILQSYTSQLPLVLLHNEERLGLTLSLLKGWGVARGDYIARMDADDISYPRRFEHQMTWMRRHPDAGVCGTWARIIGQSKGRIRTPVNMQDIHASILWECPFVHSSVMFRRSVMAEAGLTYDPEFCVAQDLELWSRLVLSGVVCGNVSRSLVAYRMHSENITSTRQQERRQASLAIYRHMLDVYSQEPVSDDELELHLRIVHNRLQDNEAEIRSAYDWFERAVSMAETMGQRSLWLMYIRKVWFAVCYRNCVERNSALVARYMRMPRYDFLGKYRMLLLLALGKKALLSPT